MPASELRARSCRIFRAKAMLPGSFARSSGSGTAPVVNQL